MADVKESFRPEVLRDNLRALADNPYPGRGMVLGKKADGKSAVQVYWVMGRGTPSRDRRVEIHEESTGAEPIVKVEPRTRGEVVDKNLVYNAMLSFRHPVDKVDVHIASNGNHTDDVFAAMQAISRFDKAGAIPEAFASALLRRTYEDDEPNYTPRITGLIAVRGSGARVDYDWSFIRKSLVAEQPEYTLGGGNLDDIPDGAGLCFHTYEGNGSPLPSFVGSPYPIASPTGESARDMADDFWGVLNSDNRVGIAVKSINLSTGVIDLAVRNALPPLTEAA